MILNRREELLLQCLLEGQGDIRNQALERWFKEVKIVDPTSWSSLPHHPENILLPVIVSAMEPEELEENRFRQILRGIQRATKANNLAVMGRGRELIEKLALETRVVVFKGSSLIAHGLPLGRRRISDLDIVVPPSQLKDALRILESMGFRPHFGVSPRQLLERELPRRNGWNFVDGRGAQIDLHWSLFAREPRYRELTAKFWSSTKPHVLFGPSVAVSDLNFSLSYSSYHSRTRATRQQHLLALADLMFFSSRKDISSMKNWAVDGLHERWIQEDVGTVLRVTSDQESEPPRSRLPVVPPREPWIVAELQPRYAHKKSAFYDLACGMDRNMYRGFPLLTGAVLHGVPSSLKPLVDRPGLLTRASKAAATGPRETFSVDCTSPDHYDSIATIGWQWDPLDRCLWSDSPESRLHFGDLTPQSLYKVTLHLHPLCSNEPRSDGQFSANPRGKVFSRGKHIQTYDLQRLESPGELTIVHESSKEGAIELAFQPLSPVMRKGLNAVYLGWCRGLPIQSVTVASVSTRETDGPPAAI
jgi:hypothetical protein